MEKSSVIYITGVILSVPSLHYSLTTTSKIAIGGFFFSIIMLWVGVFFEGVEDGEIGYE